MYTTTHGNEYHPPYIQQRRFGEASGKRNADLQRYEGGRPQKHLHGGGAHTHEESLRDGTHGQHDQKWEHHGHEDSADRYGEGRVHVHGDVHVNEESQNRDGQWEHHAHEDAADRYGEGRVHVHGGAHTSEETASKDLWTAGSGAKYATMESRKEKGVNLLKRRKSITHDIGSSEHVTIAHRNKEQHRGSVAGDVTSRDKIIPLAAYAHHDATGGHHNSDESATGEYFVWSWFVSCSFSSCAHA